MKGTHCALLPWSISLADPAKKTITIATQMKSIMESSWAEKANAADSSVKKKALRICQNVCELYKEVVKNSPIDRNRLRCRGPLLTKRVIEKARVRATNLNTSESFAASTAANGLLRSC